MKKVFRFIHTEKVNYPVAVLAKVLRVKLPDHLSVDPSTPAAFFATAKALLGKKGPR